MLFALIGVPVKTVVQSDRRFSGVNNPKEVYGSGV